MIFHEKLNFKFDPDKLVEGLEFLKTLGDPATNGNFGGWAIQSSNGDWQEGFQLTPYSHEFFKRTEACAGIWEEILNDLEDRGLKPHRARVTMIAPGDVLRWHRDSVEDDYCIRLHIPIVTNPQCEFEVQDVGSVHMPADGYAHLIDASNMHRAWNRGTEPRYHFLAQVWDTKGCSEHFALTESRKNLQSFYQLQGYQTYLKVMDEKEKRG